MNPAAGAGGRAEHPILRSAAVRLIVFERKPFRSRKGWPGLIRHENGHPDGLQCVSTQLARIMGATNFPAVAAARLFRCQAKGQFETLPPAPADIPHPETKGICGHGAPGPTLLEPKTENAEPG